MRSEFLASPASPPPYVPVVLPGQQALGEPEKPSCFLWDESRKGIVHDEIVSGQQTSVASRHLERRPVILSAAKDLASLPQRSFAALKMTVRTFLTSAHGRHSLQMSAVLHETASGGSQMTEGISLSLESSHGILPIL